MSDDEDFYDDFEIIWIDEPEPGIADDLAETAHHDPVVLDHPSFDTEDYFSDWDDMSDEYYDDDPTVLKRQRMAHKIAEAQKTKPTPAGPSIGSGIGIDPRSFQSVVWKSLPDRDRDHDQAHQQKQHLHPAGEGEKVALLKNWREVFRFSNPAVGRKSKSKAPTAAARSGVVDGKREDSSDRTSGVLSLENLRENEIEGADSGDASNTTPAESASPRIAEAEAEAEAEEEAGAGQDAEMVDAPVPPPAGSGRKKVMKPSPSSNVVVEIPVLSKKKAPPPSPPTQSPPKDAAPLPKKKGRKRKADLALTPAAAAPAPGAEGARDGGPGETAKRPRSTRVASRDAGQAGDRSTRSSAGSVRRSTRQ
ncbi:hypothetical protein PHISP_02870 [Aspergillus sp. HF37]|nr:hypothetical protein PHISP_02870 [Aspergillus sp. HF37]